MWEINQTTKGIPAMSEAQQSFADRPETPQEEENLAGASADLLDLLNQVDQDIKGWLPKVGDKVFGTIVDISTATSEYGEYPLIIIETPSGVLTGVHCFHTVLRNEINKKIERGMSIGWQIAIAFRGEGDSNTKGNAPQMYRVAVKPPKE